VIFSHLLRYLGTQEGYELTLQDYASVAILKSLDITYNMAVNLGSAQVAHEATTEDKERCVKKLRYFRQLKEGNIYKVSRIYKEVRIRKV
jgi:hypothetical protein